MIALTHPATGDSVDLPADLFWSDEFSWSPVEQSTERSVTGSLIVQTSERIGGRPITLEPDGDDSAWITRADLEQLQAWASVPGLELELSLRGQIRTVIFRHHDGPAIEAKPLMHFEDVQPTDNYLATVRLMEI